MVTWASGKQPLDRLRQQVRGGVANDLEAFLVARGNDAQGCVVVDNMAGVDQLAVDLAAQGGLGQAGADIAGHLHHADGLVKFSLAAVRQGNRWHDNFRLSVKRKGAQGALQVSPCAGPVTR